MLGTKFYKNNYDLKEYSRCAEWCNNNNATITDKGEYYECVEIPAPALDEVKNIKISELKQRRDAEEQTPITYGGYRWDFDDKAIQRINGAIIALGDEDTITWTTADNEEIVVNQEDLNDIIKASAIRSNALHVKYRELKHQVEQAETEEQIKSIVW